MKFSNHTLISVLFSITILSAVMAKAEDETFELQVESEIATADAVFDVDAAQTSDDNLEKEREVHSTQVPRLREEIRQAYVTQKWARKQINANEKEAAHLEKERTTAQKKLNTAQLQVQKIERDLKSVQAQLNRKQKSRDAVVEKKEIALARIKERTAASQAMVAQAQLAERELKLAEAQYQKTLQLERDQKVALAKKQANLKKRIAEAKVKTNRVKFKMNKVVIGRAG